MILKYESLIFPNIYTCIYYWTPRTNPNQHTEQLLLSAFITIIQKSHCKHNIHIFSKRLLLNLWSSDSENLPNKPSLIISLHKSLKRNWVHGQQMWEENFIPHIKNTRKTPMATIWHRWIFTPTTHMSITSKGSHTSNMKNINRHSHFLRYLDYGIRD